MKFLRYLTLLLIPAAAAAQSGVERVDPFIGTGGHGHTHPSAIVPFGMVQPGPDTRKTGWDGCSGYHYSDSTLYGFSQTHLSGTGVSDYADILLKPLVSIDSLALYAPAAFIKNSEVASPGYYRVELSNGIMCELTATARTAIHRYTFPPGSHRRIFVDLNYRDEVLNAVFSAGSDTSFTGLRFSRGWAQNQKLFFAGRVSHPFKWVPGAEDHTGWLDFGTGGGPVEIQIALSSVDVSGAGQNLTAEKADFDNARGAAVQSWENELGKMQIWSKDPADEIIFSTALYHAFSVPNLWSDVDGRYRGMDDEIHRDTLHAHYTVFSLWDTYRTAHPLYAILQPERTADFIETMLCQYEASGRLPVWELAANETNCMIGYHSVSVLADAVAKGYSLDGARLLRAMDATAEAPVFGLPDYMRYGFLSVEDEAESVSKTLEYSYDDACISWTASFFGDTTMALKYARRATAYRSVIDPQSGLVRARTNGSFLADADPREVNNHYTEANAWQYSFSPVHDLQGWFKLLGKGDAGKGRAKVESNLDALFAEENATTGRTQVDITGLIGQYAHGNEPSHHIAWLYNVTGSPFKTQERIAEILGKFYTVEPDGLVGNEDCGQMSAWYIMAGAGIYPLVPGIPVYMLTTPAWDSLRVVLPNGNRLKISTHGEGDYVNHLTVNGKDYTRNYISHDQLLKGGIWNFYLSKTPTDWGMDELFTTDLHTQTPAAPVLEIARSFKDSTFLVVHPSAMPADSMVMLNSAGKRFRTVDDTLRIYTTDTLYAAYYLHGEPGHIARAIATRKPGKWKAQITAGIPNPQYTAGGDAALVDGITGDADWRKGGWIGAQDQDVIIELTHPAAVAVSTVDVHLLKDIRSWIAFPERVILYVESNGKWNEAGTQSLKESALSPGDSETRSVKFVLPDETVISRLKIKLINPGPLPAWHPGAGGASFIFLDEIRVD